MKTLCSLWGSISMALMFITFAFYEIFPPSTYIVIGLSAVGLVVSIAANKKDKDSAKDERNKYYMGIAFNFMALFWTAVSPWVRAVLFSKGEG